MFSKLKRILYPENMLFKMIILNCGLLLLVTLVLTAAGNYIYEESIAERSYANTMEIQNQVLKSLDLIFKSVEDNVEALGNYPEVQEYLKVDAENQQASRVELERQVRDLLLDYSRIYSEYLNIVVVSEKGQYLSNDSYRVKKLPLTEEKWYQDAVLANGELVLSPTSLGRNLKAWKNYSTDNYVSTVKLICDRQTSAGIGVILIDLDLKSIQNLVEDITMGQTGFGYIQDSQGHVLYAPQNEVVYRMNPNWVTDGESGRVRCRIKGKDYNVIYSHSKYTDLTAVGVFDWGKTIEGISRARTVSKWIAVIIMIFAAGATVIFSASITRPISTLSKLMKKAQTGDMICTLFTGQTSKEGIFMRYSYEFKLLCVDLYKSGIYPDTPNGTTDERFKKNVREWARMVDSNGPEVLKHKVFNKVWSPEEKLALVSQVIAGKSRTDVALKAGINPGMLYQWVQKYKTIGYNGLVENRKGRPPQISDMKKSTNPNPLTESEREELIRLRAENEYIKAENEVIKKRIALRQEKWAAQLKAKKQQLSKNLEKRDTN